MAIKYPKCQTDNPDKLKFCSECGTKSTSVDTPDESFIRTLEPPVEKLLSWEDADPGIAETGKIMDRMDKFKGSRD